MTYAVKSDSQQGGEELTGEKMRSGDVICESSDVLWFAEKAGKNCASASGAARYPSAQFECPNIDMSPICHIACSLAAIQ